jgi:hypothetical protein
MLPEYLGRNQNFLRTSPGRLDRPPTQLDRPPQTERENRNRGSTLNFASPDLPIHPKDCRETLGVPGSPHGRPLSQRNCTETLSIKGNHKSRDSTSRTRAPTRTTKSKNFPRVWRGKVTKKRGARSSCVTPTPNPAKKCLQNRATKISRKGSENH